MPVDAILGHRPQLLALKTDLEQNNVAHAYLFSGAKHLGKFTIAKWFARQLLCYGHSEEECAAIGEQIDRLLHTDLLVIDQLWIEEVCEDSVIIAQSSNVQQQHRMKTKAKTDTISIDDIRALQDRLHEIPAAYRCCLIRSVERMQDEAVNALLKILEEPPQGVVFLLTTQAFPLLLPTLVSRTRVLHFDRLTDADLEPLMKESASDDRQFLLRVAQGAPGIVRRLRDNPDLLRHEKQVYSNALAFWHSHSAIERLKFLVPLHERGIEADQFLLHLSLALREESPTDATAAAHHLIRLCRNLGTNVNRQLLAQQFVLALAAE